MCREHTEKKEWHIGEMLLVNGSGWASACCRTLYSRLHVVIQSMSKYTLLAVVRECVERAHALNNNKQEGKQTNS